MTAYNAALTDKDNNVIYPQTKAANILDANDIFVQQAKFDAVSGQSQSNNDSITNLKNQYNYDIPNIQKSINDLNTFENQVNSDNTSWSSWTTNGMTLLNGAQIYGSDSDYPQYRTRKVNGSTQAQILFRIKNLTTGNDTAYVGFPDFLFPVAPTQVGFSTPTSFGRTASWIIDGNNYFRLHGTSDNTFDPTYWYPFIQTFEVKGQ